MIGRFTKDTLVTIATQILIFAFSWGVSIIVVRILGPERKGIYKKMPEYPTALLWGGSL